MPGLNVVALISGGKDSLFSILHCHANGHKVVALANLHPPHTNTGSVDDLESYMYQTIGHAVIPLYEQALGLPVYRQEILGDAVNRDKSYGLKSSQDETESLLPLLRRVLAAHPEINAVSTGAILSDYQRTRVESVALRLGLTPLSYLWQWPSLPPGTSSSLLEDMAAAGQDSRIIKAASGGLDDSLLWHNVAETRTIARLSKAAKRFGTEGDGAVLGEGGEYETLAVSGPPPLWKGRIVVPPEGVQTVLGEGGSASVKITRPSVAMNDDNDIQKTNLRLPPLLDSRFETMHTALTSVGPSEGNDLTATSVGRLSCDPHTSAQETCLQLSNLVGDGQDVSTQTRAIMDRLAKTIEEAGHQMKDIAYTIIILRDMCEFAAVNAIYGSYFLEPNPPARLTIACADVLPADAFLAISLISVMGPRQGLHVQSRSYWAPANIGPYSQAIAFPGEENTPAGIRGAVYIAGQIPLVPSSMDLPSADHAADKGNFSLQSVLALQHLVRIGKVMKVRRWNYGIAFLAKAARDVPTIEDKEELVRRSWQHFHAGSAASSADDTDEAEDFDVWNVAHGSGSKAWRVADAEESGSSDDPKVVPPLAIYQVDALPRGSEIEWIGYGNTTTAGDAVYPLHLQSILDSFGRN